MHNTIQRMKRAAFPRLNEQPYTFEDVESIAKRENLKLLFDDLPPDLLGYLSRNKPPAPPGQYMVLSTQLDEVGRTFIGLHELTHYFVHMPISSKQYFYCPKNADHTYRKHDCEANNIALIAMIPYPLMLELAITPAEDLHPAIADFCLQRKRLWISRGI